MTTVFTADWICPVSSSPIGNASLVVENGRIRDVREMRSGEDEGVRTRFFPGCAIVPGFVNVHTHLELTLFRGLLEGLEFADWIRTLTRTKYDRLGPGDLRISAALGAAECLGAGVTAVGEVMDAGAGWEAMVGYGLRGVAYQEVFGPSPDVAEEAEAGLREKLRRLGASGTGRTLRLGVSPHAPYSVSEALYRRVGELASAESLPLALHIGESREEGRFVRSGEGPFAEAWAGRGIPVVARGQSPLEYVGGLGVLGPRTLAIHAIDASGEDVRRLAETGTSVAHCPKSNLKLGHGIAPLRELLDAGVTVGLGTDSVASNNVVDMFEEMRMAVFLQRTRLSDPGALTAAEAFHLATLGGARCLGLDADLGSLEPGKLADFLVVDLGELATQPVYDPIDAMVFSAGRRNVRATYLEGRKIRLRTDALLGDAQEIARRLKP